MKSAIVKVGSILFALVLLAKLFAFIRDPLVAAFFGANHNTDAFFSAFTITNLLFSILVPVITAIILPMFIHDRQRQDNREVWRKITGLLIITGLVLIIVAVIMVVGANWLVALMSPGYDVATRLQTVEMVRIMSPLIVALPLSFLITALLNAEKRFYWPGIMPVIGNALILAVLCFSYHTAGIHAVAWGTLVGTLAQLLIAWLTIHRKLVWAKNMFAGARLWWLQVWRLGWPVLLSAALFNLNSFMLMPLGSYHVGTYSYLTYGIRLQQVFLDLMFTSFATAIFPFLAEAAAQADHKRFQDLRLFGLKLFTLVLVPITAILIALRLPLIEGIYQRQAIDASMSQGISTALALFALSLVGFGIVEVINRSFYAKQNTRTPLIMTAIGTAVGLMFYFTIGQAWSGLGLALAYSLGALVTAITGLIVINREGLSDYFGFLAKVGIAGAIGGLVAAGLYRATESLSSSTYVHFSIAVVVSAISLIVFVGLNWLLRVKEIRQVTGIIRARLSRTPAEPKSL